jgi:putative membrane protein
LSKQEVQALTRLAQADLAEIEAGKLAAQKASSPDVKKYGEHMVEEHSKMLEEGKKVAEAKGVKPPAAPDKKHQDALKKLQSLSGAEFDRQYVRQMVKDHSEVLELAQKTARNAKDPDLKAHVEEGTPHVKDHLKKALELQASLGSASKGLSRPKK